jgi:hypothetical protein
MREQPESRRDWTVLVAWDRASVLAEGDRVEAEPRVGGFGREEQIEVMRLEREYTGSGAQGGRELGRVGDG